jgi:hypothetical protein
MTMTPAYGCFLNTSEYVQILGDTFDDNSLAAPWVSLNGALREASQRLEVKSSLGALTPPASVEGGLYAIPVVPVAGEYVQWFAQYMNTQYTVGSGLSVSGTELNFNATGEIHVYIHGNNFMRLYVSGSQVYTQTIDTDAGQYYKIVWTANGFDFYIDGALKYQRTSGALTGPYYFYAQSVNTVDAFEFRIDHLSYTGYGTFTVHDSGTDSIHYNDGFYMASLAVTHSGATNIGLRFRTGANGSDWGDWTGWYTEAEFQSLTNVEDPYMQLEVRFKGGIGAYISAVTLDELSDVTAPTAPTLEIAIRQTIAAEKPVLFGAGAAGSDETEYAATTVEVYVSGAWYEILSDFTVQESGTAETPATLYQPPGGDTAEADLYFALMGGDSAAETIFANTTQLRLRGWDATSNSAAGTAETITSGGSGESPDASTLTSSTAGDGQVTLAVLLNAADDPAYAIWRTSSGAWTTPSESFKATADGNIVVTGLTNGTPYTFLLVSKNGDLYSLPSTARTATPTAGETLSIEAALRALMIANTDVLAIVSTRIYPNLAPQNATFPLIIFQRIASVHDSYMLSASGFVSVNIQVDAYAETYSESKELADAIRVALHGYGGNAYSGAKVLNLQSCILESERDGFDNPDGGKESGVYRVIQEYAVTCGETVRGD